MWLLLKVEFEGWRHEITGEVHKSTRKAQLKHDARGTRIIVPLRWRHNQHNGVPNHRRLDCLLGRLFKRRSKKTSKLRVTGLCEGNSPVTGEFPAQRASNAENVSIWWRHHVLVWFSKGHFHILYDFLIGPGAIARLPQWQRHISEPVDIKACQKRVHIYGIYHIKT